MSGLRGMGFLIYREAQGICPDYDKGGSALGNVGWIGVFGRCLTLHQSRVQLDGIPTSLSSGFHFLCELSPQWIKSRHWIFTLGYLLGCELN